MSTANRHLLALSAQIVAAHAGNNEVEANVLPGMIRSVFNTLSDLAPASSIAVPVVEWDTSSGPDHHNHDHDGHGRVPRLKAQSPFGVVCRRSQLSRM